MSNILSPANGLQTVLRAVDVVDGTTGWVSFTGQEPPEPDMVVTIYDSGGPAPEVSVGINHPSAQIIVRGARQGYNDAYGKCLEIRRALLAIPTPRTDWPELTSVVERTDVQSLGRDQSARPRFSMNFQLITTPEPADAGYRM